MLVHPPFADRVTEWQPSDPAIEHPRLLRTGRGRAGSRRVGAEAADVIRRRDTRAHVRRRRARDPRHPVVRARPAWCSCPLRSATRSRAAPAPVREPLNRSLAVGAVGILGDRGRCSPCSAIRPGTSASGRRARLQRSSARAPPRRRVCSRPTVTPTGCSGSSPSSVVGWHTTCASSSTTLVLRRAHVVQAQDRPAGTSLVDPYRVVVVDEESTPKQADALLRQPGSRALYRDDKITVVLRPVTS